MKEYTSDKLRSVGIVAHGGAGKTTIAEALLFRSGAITRMGKVEDGATISDFEPEELKRKVTISSTLIPCEWKDTKINFIDTPGYADFVGEVKGTLRAVDSALVVVCASSGLEVGTEKVWQYAEELDLPRVIFVSKMDRENADFEKVVKQLKDIFGNKVIPLQIAIGAENNFRGIVDIVKMKAYIANGNEYIEEEIPEDLQDIAQISREEIIESAAEMNDDTLEKFLNGEELTEEEVMRGLVEGIKQAKIYPVLCGTATKNIGIGRVLDSIKDYTPSAAERTVVAKDKKTGEDKDINVNDPLSALVFKTTTDPFVGRLSFIRVFSGKISPDSTLYNVTKDKIEKVGNIFSMRGKQQIPLKAIYAGDIGVIAKLQDTETGDTICDKSTLVEYSPIKFPKPMYTMAIEAKNKGDEDKIGMAINRMMDEDPTFRLEKNTASKEKLISGVGDQHIEIILEKMKRKFGVDAILKTPKITYRETIRGKARVEGKHKKQSGGHGQYGHVWIEVEPLPTGSGFEFVDSIVGGAVPRQYIPAVEKGMRESMLTGVLAGYPVVDIKINLVDGTYHNVDSSEMAFKIASNTAFKKGCLQSKPVLLEPVYNIEVIVPQDNMGDIVGDFNTKRGKILGMEPIGNGLGSVKALVPYSELQKYAIDLRSMTQGRGSFDMNFAHYDEVPQNIADKIIAASVAEKE